MEKEKCPYCSNHCPKDNLGCGRGREHFKNQDHSNDSKSLSEQVIVDLRECGHWLHHNRELDATKLLSNFSKDELNKLHELLSKMKRNTQ